MLPLRGAGCGSGFCATGTSAWRDRDLLARHPHVLLKGGLGTVTVLSAQRSAGRHVSVGLFSTSHSHTSSTLFNILPFLASRETCVVSSLSTNGLWPCYTSGVSGSKETQDARSFFSTCSYSNYSALHHNSSAYVDRARAKRVGALNLDKACKRLLLWMQMILNYYHISNSRIILIF